MNRTEFVNAHPISDVLRSNGISLPKNGMILCLFHKEKSPSMHVNIDKGLFHCFGCGKGGSVIDLLAHLQDKAPGQILAEAGRNVTWHRRPAAPRTLSKPEPIIDWTALLRSYRSQTTEPALEQFANGLGVAPSALRALGCCRARDHHAWAFPMRNGDGEVVGIRLRLDTGKKIAVRGSKEGIFIPDSLPEATVFLTEGPTDAAACLTLGLYAIGRPSCLGGMEHLKTALKRLQVRRAVILADNDLPGIQGAKRLAGELGLPACVTVLPAKDAREFLRLGGTRQMLEATVKESQWTKR